MGEPGAVQWLERFKRIRAIMQLTKTLKVTPEELFDALAGSIMQDIENVTGKRPSRNKLNGYKYEKRPYRKR